MEKAREQAHLERILSVVARQLDAAGRCAGARHDALVSARRELREGSEQLFYNLSSSDDFEALANLNQMAQPLAVSQKTQEMELQRIQSLVRMQDAPYFARIDMRFDDGGDTEQVYIGRATLKDDQTHEVYVHDWRSPIASVFYRFGVGPAHYEAPAGRITGTVLLKRQYEIKGGKLDFFFDADVQIQDEFLRSLLSKNASPRMRSIVETIQRDQDLAIRDDAHELLMVQGVAGSGKTSIALHRVAYLMYEGLASRLSAHSIMILSPNALFERYIESVLPELGERSVGSATFERLLEGLLDAPVQPRTERFESMCAAHPEERRWMRASLAFKASEAFTRILDRFVDALPGRIALEDVYYGGQTIATRQQLRQRLLKRDGSVPLGVRLLRMEMSLLDGLCQRRPARLARLQTYAQLHPEHVLELLAFPRACSILESGILKRHIRRFTRLDCRALYSALVADEHGFRRLAGGIELPEELPDILRATRDALNAERLPFDDASAIAYLRLKLMGGSGQEGIRQLVIDEAQDYGALQFATLNLLFPRARLTVLGDVNQAIDRTADMALYEQMRRAFHRRSAALVELTKSFRCTSQILGFSLRFLRDSSRIECFSRAGDAPVVRRAESAEQMDALIADALAACRKKGYASIALIAKTAPDARAWHARLGAKLGVRLADAGALGDAFVIPLALSKGLEFDAVLVLDADAAHYGEPEDRSLLYVACTRALHRLWLVYEGQRSPHLSDEEVRG